MPQRGWSSMESDVRGRKVNGAMGTAVHRLGGMIPGAENRGSEDTSLSRLFLVKSIVRSKMSLTHIRSKGQLTE